MASPRRSLVLALAAAALTAGLGHDALGLGSEVLHFAPAGLLLFSMFAGCFPGERILRSFAGRPLVRRDRAASPRRRHHARSAVRVLLTWERAVRPPPPGLVVSR